MNLEPRKDKRGQIVCDCGGYHFPHRKTSGACTHSSRADYYHAMRAGVPEPECMALLSAADLRRFYPIPTDPLTHNPPAPCRVSYWSKEP